MKSIELDEAASGLEHRHERYRESIHVRHRQGRCEAVVRAIESAVAAETRVEAAGLEKILVRQDAALGLPGRPRGVEERGFAALGDGAVAGRRASSRRRSSALGPSRSRETAYSQATRCARARRDPRASRRAPHREWESTKLSSFRPSRH